MGVHVVLQLKLLLIYLAPHLRHILIFSQQPLPASCTQPCSRQKNVTNKVQSWVKTRGWQDFKQGWMLGSLAHWHTAQGFQVILVHGFMPNILLQVLRKALPAIL